MNQNTLPLCRYGKECYRQCPQHRQRFAHPEGSKAFPLLGIDSLSTRNVCPCGGGQSCLVDRRLVGDWVHEDDVFKSAGLDVRLDCTQEWNPQQQRAMQCAMRGKTLVKI